MIMLVNLSLMDQMPMAIFIIDLDHQVCYWNDQCVDLTGISKEEIRASKQIAEHFYREERLILADLIVDGEKQILDLYSDFEKHGDWYIGIVHFPKVQNTERYFHCYAKPLYKDGQLRGAIEILLDITLEKQLEVFNRNLYENSSEAIIVYDKRTLDVIFANNATLRLFNCAEAGQILGNKVMDLATNGLDEIDKLNENVQKNGFYRMRYDYVHENGELLHLVGNCRLINYRGKESILINIKDITNEVQAIEEKNQTYEGILKVLSKAIDYRDHYTERHSERVKEYSVKLAERLRLPEPLIEEIRIGSMLHDLGKVGIPDEIMKKKGLLTSDEYEKIKEHPLIGHRIIEPIQVPTNIKAVILFHHERWDGKGYPLGIKGEEIPLPARIVAIADAFDAMTSNRVYRKALSLEDALQEIEDCGGSQFDQHLSSVFVKMIRGELEQCPDIA